MASDPVELAAAVVGDDDRRRRHARSPAPRPRPVVDALDQDRQLALGGERLEVGQPSAGSISSKVSAIVTARSEPSAAATLGTPRPSGITKPVRRSRSRLPARGASTVTQDRLEARRDRLLHQRPGHARVAEAVELEPAAAARRGRGDLGRAATWPGSRGTSRCPPPPRRAPSPPRPRGRPSAGRRPARPGSASRARPRAARRALDSSRLPASIRGRSRQRPQAATLSRSVTSSPAPPAK